MRKPPVHLFVELEQQIYTQRNLRRARLRRWADRWPLLLSALCVFVVTPKVEPRPHDDATERAAVAFAVRAGVAPGDFVTFEVGIPKAHAADVYLGTIVSAGTDITNSTTGAPFVVGTPNKLSVQCDAIAYVLVDTATAVTASNGAKVQADQLFQTSTSATTAVVTIGGQVSAIVRVISAVGTANCKVFRRYGNE